MSERILIIDHIQDLVKDGEVIGKECFDKTGNSLKVKKGKGGTLEARWDELLIGRAYSFTMGEFKGYPFVETFKSVESQFVQQAQEKVEDQQVDTKNRSVALSYGKDLAVAKLIDVYGITEWAEVFYRYMNGDLKVEEARVIKLIGGKYETILSKNAKGSQEIPGVEDRQHSREETGESGADDTGGNEAPVKNAQELMAWCLSHSKAYTPSWVRKQVSLGDAVITDEVAVRVYEEIRSLMDWS